MTGIETELSSSSSPSLSLFSPMEVAVARASAEMRNLNQFLRLGYDTSFCREIGWLELCDLLSEWLLWAEVLASQSSQILRVNFSVGFSLRFIRSKIFTSLGLF